MSRRCVASEAAASIIPPDMIIRGRDSRKSPKVGIFRESAVLSRDSPHDESILFVLSLPRDESLTIRPLDSRARVIHADGFRPSVKLAGNGASANMRPVKSR